jgi:hypothetical protein
MATIWIRDDILDRVDKVGPPGVSNRQQAFEELLNFYEKYKDKVKPKGGNK